MPTTYKPGMTFEEFFAANDYPHDVGGYIEARGNYEAFKKNEKEYGAVGNAISGPGSTLAKIQDPLYGLEVFERLAAASTPSYADYAARVASLGGSARQAREQEEAGTRAAQGGAFEAFERFRLGKDSNVLNASLNLYAQQLQNQQFQQSGGDDILNNILGIGASLAGQYVGSKLFQPEHPPPTYPNPYGGYYNPYGGNFGGTQQTGQQRMDRPSGPSYDYFGY